MWIRYKHAMVDGVPAHKAIRGASEYVFLDTEDGVCEVRDRAGIEYLLARPANYEIAFEKYGIVFDVTGKEVEVAPTTATTVETAVETARVNTAISRLTLRSALPSLKRKPGRPRRG